MRIAYVAKHGSGGNQDEDAITHALTELGHDVDCIPETRGMIRGDADLLLFHKWYNLEALKALKGRMVRAFWYFDLVDYPDQTLDRRCRNRIEWMEHVIPETELGFCTDGDWARKLGLYKLEQGADSRFTGIGVADASIIPILFTGIGRGGGERRTSFVEEMSTKYGSMFRHVRDGIHGRDLADLVASSSVVVAADAPLTDDYWSNRAYLILGFGGFLLHPFCRGIAKHYEDGKEIVYYWGREDLHQKITHYLSNHEERREIAAAGLARTLKEHTYVHRCQELIRRVEEYRGSHAARV